MSVLSKYVDKIASKYDESGLPKTAISQAIMATALIAYAIKLTYPHLKGDKKKITKEHTAGGLTPTSAHDAEEDSKLAEAEKLLVEQNNKKNKSHLEPGLNKEFLKQLQVLLKVMIPRPFCYETGLLGVHTVCLISRTFLSIYVAALEGAIVKFIVRKDVKQFAIVLMKWFGIAIPATFINSMIRFLESKLSLAFR